MSGTAAHGMDTQDGLSADGSGGQRQRKLDRCISAPSDLAHCVRDLTTGVTTCKLQAAPGCLIIR